MKLHVLFSFFAASLLLGACGRSYHVDEAGVRILPVELKHQDVKLEDIFERVEVIPLETNDSCLIRSIGRVIDKDSMIYLFDVTKVRKFKPDGTYAGSIGRKGQGPGEYYYVEDFDIDPANGDVYILSPFGYVYRYTSGGKFVERYSPCYQPNYQNIRFYNDSCWFTWTLAFWDDMTPPSTFFNKDFTKVSANPSSSFYGPDMTYASVEFSELDGRLFAAFTFGPEIYEISPDTVITRYRWDFGKDMTSEATLTKYHQPLDDNPEVNMRRDQEFFADLGIKYFQNDQFVTDRYIYNRLIKNDDFDKSNPPKDLVLTYYRVLYDLKKDKAMVFDGLNGELLKGRVRGMTNDYLLEVVEPERFKFYKDYLPEGMSLEDIDVEEANPMLAKFYFKRK